MKTILICLALIASFFIGRFYEWHQDMKLNNGEYAIKDELMKEKPVTFLIGCLHFTKRADGSAVVRVKE